MPHVSRKKLSPEAELSIQKLFVELVSKLKTKEEIVEFFEAFFSRTERVMFAKRFLIFYLLEKGNKSEEIAGSLNVSRATVVRLKLKKTIEEKKLANAFNKIDKTVLRESLKDLAKEIGLKVAVRIAKGGRFDLPRGLS